MKRTDSQDRPPRFFSVLFELVVRSEEKRTVAGDLDELFSDIIQSRGRLRAAFWYALQILSAFPSFVFNSLYWRMFMFLNYMKITLRNIRKHKAYSLINIAGLAIGIACTILIMLWVQDELSYDRFHENADRLYALTFSNGSTVTPTALSEYLKREYGEVIQASRYSGMGKNLMKYEENEIYQDYGAQVDPDFLRMFTVPFSAGNPETALDDPRSIILSQNVASKLFGEIEPIGQMVTIGGNMPLKVTGVFFNYPSNSHIRFEYILPLELAKSWGRDLNTWDRNNIRTYVRLREGVSAASMNEKISGVVEKHRPQDKRPLSLQSITRMYINPLHHNNVRLTFVYVFSAIAFFVLLIACINFINLTTARSMTRAKEIGIRKAVGAQRSNLVKQFFGESLFLTILSFIGAIGLVFLLLPRFNQIAGKIFTWEYLLRQNVLLGILGIVLVTVFLSGTYPALFLSRLQPVRVLGGTPKTVKGGAFFRKILVVIQFSLTAFLILGMLVIFRQVHYLQVRDVGFDKDNVVVFNIGSNFARNIDTIKTDLLSHPNIQSITLVDIAPYRWMSNAGVGDVDWEGKSGQQVKMVVSVVDYDFLTTFGLKLDQGRFFAREIATDARESYVVNQAAVRAMQMEEPLGKRLKIWESTGRIIGVVKDYHFESLHNPIIPMAMKIDPSWYNQACIRIAPVGVAGTLEILENKWKEIYPEYPFEYDFLDDRLAANYRAEQATGRIVSIFTILALFISCLGIFGLSSYTAERRTKEIGIRKVLGASSSKIVAYMSKEFLLLIVIANVLAWPFAFLVMSQWLKTFAFRISISWWTFLITGLIMLIISLFTAGLQITKAARTNPAKTLRYE
jgi:putative ABC transport system permease protein